MKHLLSLVFIISTLISCKKDPLPPQIAEATFTINDTTYKFSGPQDHMFKMGDSTSPGVYALHNTQPDNETYLVYAHDGHGNRLFFTVWEAPLRVGENNQMSNYGPVAKLNNVQYDWNLGFNFIVLDSSRYNFSADFDGVYKLANGQSVHASGTLRHLKIFEYSL